MNHPCPLPARASADTAPPLPDAEARRRAVLDHRTNLLVEAGAGTGKTSVLAARIAMLIAHSGAEPAEIAAVTFTERAAEELATRVRRLVRALARGEIPFEVAATIAPTRLEHTHFARAQRAAPALHAMTCTTIHGLCKRLLDEHPLDSGVAPNATVLEALRARRMREAALERSIRDALASEARADQALAEHLARDERRTRAALEDLSAHLGAPAAQSAPPTTGAGERGADLESALHAFGAVIRRLEHLLDAQAVEEPDTRAMAEAFAAVHEAMVAASAGVAQRASAALAIEQCTPGPALVTATGTWRAYRKKSKWRAAAKAAGRKAPEADALHALADDALAACRSACDALGEAVLETLRGHLERCARRGLERYARDKRLAGVVDFDDLIACACALLRRDSASAEALRERFAHLLVDEFQDTDPVQCEIVWRLSAQRHESDWRRAPLRPGALFLVGDPKQAIYRFRGADVDAYLAARARIETGAGAALLRIHANFRSAPEVLHFVNTRFAEPLSARQGQPGFAALDAARAHADTTMAPGVYTLDVDPTPAEHDARAHEAHAVAALCARWVHEERFAPGRIALLAPTGSGLWRYEEALEAQCLAVASQAGKGFYQRQEVHDLIALARLIADPHDRVALGALLRGPLVGLTDEMLLDIALALEHPGSDAPSDARRRPRLDPFTDPARLADFPAARDAITALAEIVSRSRARTPYRALFHAVERLDVAGVLARRHRQRPERALANVERFLELARDYALEGIGSFAADVTRAWQEGERVSEAVPDDAERAVALQTIHSAKGLEWDAVLVINAASAPRAQSTAVLAREADGAPVLRIAGKPCPGFEHAAERERAQAERERVRLWYVACTRAREVLVIPHTPGPARAWNRLVDFELGALAPAP